ncbi:pentatricopeptide repeat-containing protein At3g59040 isoform X2 [Spinacia oleracea]|uniref:Pentatricopeptide repeat-containing protein At3g59040 isoform X2 n=1 Tax=Spinacia oleracea TaxID=3562 RepID=A0A9R0IHJ2_SPIOL|nr:pentatricopeptide repeat-containing protein At3g59040 isoform X2 [Spinacia oleracea]
MSTRHLFHSHAPSFITHARPPPLSDVSSCQAFPATAISQQMAFANLCYINFKSHRRLEVVCLGMLAPRKFMQKRKKIESFKDSADEADQKNWRKLMLEIDETGSAVPVLISRKASNESLPKDLVLGTLVRLKQLKKWNIVGEILEWLRTQQWWNFNEMDYVMLITAYGKQGNFVKAENLFSFINKKGYAPNVVSYTSLMEAYGKGGQYSKAESVFRRMQTSGPEPSALTYQIILKIFVEGNKFTEAEQIFENLTNGEKSPLKPDQKMFHMMIYMHKKAGSYEKAYKLFSLMAERGIERSTVTFNSLMSFETNYKEVSRIYDQMQKAGLRPDVVSYALLIHAYGKARREEEALAVFEEMLDAGIRPTHKAYNILLDAFAISGMVEQAQNVFKSMRRDRFTPDLCSYTSMLLAYINASDMDGAEKFFKRLRVDGLEPNIITYGTLLKGYAKVNNLEKMMETYEGMVTCGIKANQTIFTTIMDASGKNKDFASAVFWFKEMDNRGCPPDQKAKNILLSLAKTEEEQEEANELVGGGNTSSLISQYNSDDDDTDEAYFSDDETDVNVTSESYEEEVQDELMANNSS